MTDSIDKGELLEKLSASIFNLSPASRAVLILHYQNDLPLSEIAEILGVGLVALGIFVNQNTLRVLRAIELIAKTNGEKP